MSTCGNRIAYGLHTFSSGYEIIFLQQDNEDRLFHPVYGKIIKAKRKFHSYELKVLVKILQRFRAYLIKHLKL